MTGAPSAIVAGIGATELSRDSGRGELALACEAVLAALADAGMTPADVDGVVRNASDVTTETMLASSLGIEGLRYFSVAAGGGGPALVGHAAMAIAYGLADVVVGYRSLRGRSGRRQGRPGGDPGNEIERAHGLLVPAHRYALVARRHMIERGSTSEHFGMVAVAQRRHAARNPRALLRDSPLTLAQHQESRVICDPLRLHDCTLECDGAMAIVVARADRAAGLPQPPVRVAGFAQAAGADPEGSLYRPSVIEAGAERVARDVFAAAGVEPADVDVVELYDHFSPFVLLGLEAFGFCAPGDAGPFVAEGRTAWPDGELPVNTHGGNLSEGYVQGLSHVLEAVRQLRGTADCQVRDARVAFAGMNAAPTASAVVLAAGA